MLVLITVLHLVATPPRVCRSVPGADSVLRPGVVILLGEIHGTRESPRAVSDLVCLALEKRLSVTVALEIPVTEQNNIDAYLTGTETTLPEGKFWKREYQDGRSSGAMIDLLSKLRTYHELDGGLRVVALDEPHHPDGRDLAMARRLNDIVSHEPEHLVVVLTGNIHNRLSRGIRWDADYEPMGYRLVRSNPPVEILSLELTHSGGTAWVCTGGSSEDCGVRKLQGADDVPLGIELFIEPTGRPFSGRYHLGKITASLPGRYP